MDTKKILSGLKNIKFKKPERKEKKQTLKKPNKTKQGVEFHIPSKVLVFETTGTTLYGMIASCGATSGLAMVGPVSSTKSEFAESIAHVVAQLKELSGKKNLPKKAVVITPSAAGELLNLPVDPDKPRLKAQMAEMVRWELEELFVQQGDIWSLGSLIAGKGYITSEQRFDIESAEGRPSNSAAFEQLISNDQLDDCLSLQENLTGQDEELVTGWCPQGKEDGVEGFTWFGAGIGQGIRKLWVDAFSKNKLSLSWIYPQLGTASPIIGSIYEKWLLVDLRQEQIGFTQGQGNRIYSTEFRMNNFGMIDSTVVLQTIKQILHHDTEKIFISGPAALVESLLPEVQQELEMRKVMVQAVEPDEYDVDLPINIQNSMRGVARHILKICKGSLLVRIEGREPKPPVWKRKELYPLAAMVILVCGFAGFDTYIRNKTADNEWALELLDIEYKKKKMIKQQAAEVNREAQVLEEQLASKKGELAEQVRLRNILDNVIQYRQDLIPGILESVGMSVNSSVVVDMLEEHEDRSGFYLQAWSLEDTEGQLFVNRLNENLAPWHYEIENMQLERGKGRLAVEGFVLKIWIKKLTEKEDDNA